MTDVVSNITGVFREAFEIFDPVAAGRWRQSIALGDLVFVDGNAASASYLVVSKDPLRAGTETYIESLAEALMPIELAFGLSMSQRTLGQEFAIEVVDTGVTLPDIADLEITAITQTTTTITVTTATPHNLSVGKSIGLYGCLDSRTNFPSLVIASVPAPNQFTCTAGPGGTITSQSSYISSVLATTTAPLPSAVYANGTLGVGATLTASANGAFPAQDGVDIPLNGRVLVKDQASGLENGIYVLTTVGSAGTPWVLTRATDFDVTAEMTVVAGALFAVAVYIAGGATHSQKRFYLTATVTTVGTTAVTFADSNATGPVGYVYFRERIGRSQNGVSQIFENATVTNASFYIRSESGDALPSGTVGGNHAVTIATTASVQLAGSTPYTYSFTPTTEYRMVVQSDRTQWSDSPVDTLTQATGRLLRTQVCPDPNNHYKLRIRAVNNKALTIPTAQVVSVAKSGSTTGTFTTDVAHGLVTGDLIVYYGSSDTAAANFPNLSTATAITVTGPTTFTAVIGSGTTGTAYGGFVAKVQGGVNVQGVTTQTVINATLTTLIDGTRQLVLTGNGSWAGVVIGDHVNVIGVRSTAALGASLGVDGVWKVANFATTALTLVGMPGQTWPADFALTAGGGSVIRRTELRLSFIRMFDYERYRVEMLTRPAGDSAGAAPVVAQGGTIAAVTTVTGITGGGAAEDAAAGANPLTIGGVVRTAAAPTTLVAGDAARVTMTTGAAAVVQPYAVPELSWQTPAIVGGILNTATPVQVMTAQGASLRNYVTGMDLYSEALTNATDLRVREPDLSCTSQTIASNTLTVSTTHNLAIGDAVVFTASTVTGISTGVTYYVLTVPSATTITLSATRGGSTLTISGTGVTATFHKVLWMTRIPTTGAAPRHIAFPIPLRGSVNTALQVQTATASGAGAVYISIQGFGAA